MYRKNTITERERERERERRNVHKFLPEILKGRDSSRDLVID
jgi:hypothetical protein